VANEYSANHKDRAGITCGREISYRLFYCPIVAKGKKSREIGADLQSCRLTITKFGNDYRATEFVDFLLYVGSVIK
jgi:hypothetical protein